MIVISNSIQLNYINNFVAELISRFNNHLFAYVCSPVHMITCFKLLKIHLIDVILTSNSIQLNYINNFVAELISRFNDHLFVELFQIAVHMDWSFGLDEWWLSYFHVEVGFSNLMKLKFSWNVSGLNDQEESVSSAVKKSRWPSTLLGTYHFLTNRKLENGHSY